MAIEMSVKLKRSESSDWEMFDVGDVMHLDVAHSLHLFTRFAKTGAKVVAEQEGKFVVNNLAHFRELTREGKKVYSFKQMLVDGGDHLNQPLSVAGFFGGAPC